MAEDGSKGWLGIFGDFMKRLPALPSLLLVVGILFCALAVSVSLGIKNYQLAAENEQWRRVSAVVGILLLISGLFFYWRDTRSTPAVKAPGPYLIGDFPLTVNSPADVMRVVESNQTVTLKARKLGSAWPEYEVLLMHVDDQKIIPRYERMMPEVSGREYSWEVKVKLPDPERIAKEETWELAFFYVGPNGMRLVRHHREVCNYFAPNGIPKHWPTFDRWPGEMVQCSDIIRIRFDAARKRDENRLPGGTINTPGGGTPEAIRRVGDTRTSDNPRLGGNKPAGDRGVALPTEGPRKSS